MDKDSPRTTAGELQKIVESRGQKTLKKKSQIAPTSPHVCQGSVVCVMCSRLLCPYLVCFLSSSDVIIS